MRAPVLDVRALDGVEVAGRGAAEGLGVGELRDLGHHRHGPDRPAAEPHALVRLQVEAPPSGWQPLPMSEPPPAGHPALVRRRVRARVALLADHPQDRARPRPRGAGAPSGSAARRPSSPRSRAARRPPGRRRAARRPWPARARSISARGRRGRAEEAGERLLDDDVLARPRGVDRREARGRRSGRRGPRRRPPGRRAPAGRRRRRARRRTPRRTPGPARAAAPSPSGARRRPRGRGGTPRRGSAPRTPPPPLPRAPAAAPAPSPLLGPWGLVTSKQFPSIVGRRNC